MSQGLLERLLAWARSPNEEDYEVQEYVLSRREPEPENRLLVFDEPVSPSEARAEADLEPGVYLLQEIKTSGLAGEVVWEETLGEDDSDE